MTPEEIAANRRNWIFRRVLAMGCTVAAFLTIGYLMVWGADTGLHRAIVDGMVTVLVVVVPTYIGAPVADDYLRRRAQTAPPAGAPVFSAAQRGGGV